MQGTMTAIHRLLILISTAQKQGQISGQKETETLVSTIWASLRGVIHLHMGGFLGDVKAAHNVYKQTMNLMSQSLFAVFKPDRGADRG
ncbi:hypothetical protein [Paenibacillus amylolyticus]|uniref:hypothetical protein n=1 Tax=Paenibacillus amylolyticus TaxID=1451 RepID=UPI0019803BA0|nr:hypothetical protein [Paenibacillus amylolyticus]